MFDHDYIQDFLCRCRELTRFCSENGWIDNNSIAYRILERNEDHMLLAVEFTEVISEGTESAVERVPCFGQLRLDLDSAGKVRAHVVF